MGCLWSLRDTILDSKDQARVIELSCQDLKKLQEPRRPDYQVETGAPALGLVVEALSSEKLYFNKYKNMSELFQKEYPM